MEILPTVELESPQGVEVNAAIIWLHGLGADGNDFAPIVPELSLPESFGIRFVLQKIKRTTSPLYLMVLFNCTTSRCVDSLK